MRASQALLRLPSCATAPVLLPTRVDVALSRCYPRMASMPSFFNCALLAGPVACCSTQDAEPGAVVQTRGILLIGNQQGRNIWKILTELQVSLIRTLTPTHAP